MAFAYSAILLQQRILNGLLKFYFSGTQISYVCINSWPNQPTKYFIAHIQSICNGLIWFIIYFFPCNVQFLLSLYSFFKFIFWLLILSPASAENKWPEVLTIQTCYMLLPYSRSNWLLLCRFHVSNNFYHICIKEINKTSFTTDFFFNIVYNVQK